MNLPGAPSPQNRIEKTVQSSGVPFAESRILQAISRYKEAILQSIEIYLNRCFTKGFSGTNVVCGLWLVSSSCTVDPEPLFYVGVGDDKDNQFSGPTCLARNALNKANAAAQAGMDTKDMVGRPEHWLVVEGPFFPKGGAIVRRIGRVEFVVSTSGFDQWEDHVISDNVWSIIRSFIGKDDDITEGIRLSDLNDDDPKYVKYPIGQLHNDAKPRIVFGQTEGTGNPTSFRTGADGSPYPEDHLRIPEGQVSSWRDVLPHD